MVVGNRAGHSHRGTVPPNRRELTLPPSPGMPSVGTHKVQSHWTREVGREHCKIPWERKGKHNWNVTSCMMGAKSREGTFHSLQKPNYQQDPNQPEEVKLHLEGLTSPMLLPAPFSPQYLSYSRQQGGEGSLQSQICSPWCS